MICRKFATLYAACTAFSLIGFSWIWRHILKIGVHLFSLSHIILIKYLKLICSDFRC